MLKDKVLNARQGKNKCEKRPPKSRHTLHTITESTCWFSICTATQGTPEITKGALPVLLARLWHPLQVRGSLNECTMGVPGSAVSHASPDAQAPEHSGEAGAPALPFLLGVGRQQVVLAINT